MTSKVSLPRLFCRPTQVFHRIPVWVLAGILLASCGGGGGGSGGAPVIPSSASEVAALTALPDNVIPVSVTLGLSGSGVFYPNQSFVSLQICETGKPNCASIDKVLLDSGSFGLRVFDTALSGINLQTTSYQGRSLYQCAVFASGYTQGRVALADMRLGTLKAADLPIQVIDTRPDATPKACAQSGVPAITDPSQLGANAVLGIGPLAYESSALRVYYYVMQGDQASVVTGVPNSQLVAQPISRLDKHNNGLILIYPSADGSGASSLDAQMILGLDTASNNATQGAVFFRVSNSGRLSVGFNGKTYDGMIDSGANHNVFPTAYWPNCEGTVFFCPETPQSISVSLASYGAAPSTTATFNVLDYRTYGSLAVQPGLSGYSADNKEFILGLPFMYGRKTYISIQGRSTGSVPNPAVGLN
jgi:hypothetical protein